MHICAAMPMVGGMGSARETGAEGGEPPCIILGYQSDNLTHRAGGISSSPGCVY